MGLGSREGAGQLAHNNSRKNIKKMLCISSGDWKE